MTGIIPDTWRLDISPFKVETIEGTLPVFPGISIPYVLPVAYPMAPGWFIPLLLCLALDVVAGNSTGLNNILNTSATTIDALMKWGEFSFDINLPGVDNSSSSTAPDVSLDLTIFSIIIRPLLFYGAQTHTTLYLVVTLFLCSWPAIITLELLGVILGLALSIGPLIAITPVLAILIIVDAVADIIGSAFAFILSLICLILKPDATCQGALGCICEV